MYVHSCALGPAEPGRGWEDRQTVALCGAGQVPGRVSACALEAALLLVGPAWAASQGYYHRQSDMGRAG
jgi:hypothetical protein